MNRRKALAALFGLPGLGTISVADVRPDDVIVVECEGLISQEGKDRMVTYLRTVWPEPQRIVVCDGHTRLKVLRQEAINKGWLSNA